MGGGVVSREAIINELQFGDRDIRKAELEIAALVQEKGISEEEATKEIIDGYRNLPNIRVIDFDAFKAHGEIPRLGFGASEQFPAAPSTNMTVPLNTIERASAFIVFISQCWIAGWNGRNAQGEVVDQATVDEWRGYPHPDTKDNAKFKLEVQGIEKLRAVMAPGLKCYIWHDFSCMDQNGNPAGELKQLDKIVEMSDCIFTPVVDPTHEQWQYPSLWTNFFVEYAAPRFSVGPYSYINRAWCRVEMLYAANIPLRAESQNMAFSAGLKTAVINNLRPHYLYGDKEMAAKFMSPIQLPPLANSHLESLSPVASIANLTAASDATKIHTLMEELQPYLKQVKEGYEGDYRDGKRHGKGKLTWASGEVYEGDWIDNQMNGKGKLTSTSGDVYEGDYKDNKKTGKGKYTFSNGEVYEGDWIDNKKTGKGKYTFADGDVDEGDWIDGQFMGTN